MGKTRGIAFTIYKMPFPKPATINPLAVELTFVQALAKSTTGKGNRAEIGIASFMDTKSVEAQERESSFRRLPFRDGLPGRPRLTKTFRLSEASDPGDFVVRRKAAVLAQIPGEIPEGGVDRGDQQEVDMI